jgi:hypothetical protein
VLGQCRDAMKLRSPSWRALVASGLLSAFVFALALAASPELHARFHPDASHSEHECGVTLIASGQFEQAGVAPIFVTPQLAILLPRLTTLNPVWVLAAFLGGSIFEHAPPAAA